MTDETWEPAASTLGTVTSVPLPVAVHDVLASLQPPRQQGRQLSRRGSTSARPLVDGTELLGPDGVGASDDVGQGGAPSTARRPAVGAVHRRGGDGQPLREWWSGLTAAPPRATPADARAGRSPAQVAERRVPLRLLLVPAGIDLEGLMRGGVLQAGITEISWFFGSAGSLPPPETVRRRSAGDATLVDVRGTVVVVHYADPAGTHLRWCTVLDGAHCRVELRTPFPPLRAVERLVQDTLLIVS